ncbi:hypothetical protein GGX14DRAFT_665516 [Mycena pura]|uniref:Uncharacterized protein n=1 Tax=Mycena pura TaxID=153505 RepID=A0AAD6V1Q7_9AGAR|nr:hypothetical protein GGX14DRAFT_665516 [Mycena pura]
MAASTSLSANNLTPRLGLGLSLDALALPCAHPRHGAFDAPWKGPAARAEGYCRHSALETPHDIFHLTSARRLRFTGALTRRANRKDNRIENMQRHRQYLLCAPDPRQQERLGLFANSQRSLFANSQRRTAVDESHLRLLHRFLVSASNISTSTGREFSGLGLQGVLCQRLTADSTTLCWPWMIQDDPESRTASWPAAQSSSTLRPPLKITHRVVARLTILVHSSSTSLHAQ